MGKVFKFRAKVIDSDKVDGGRIVYGSLVDHGENKHCPRYWIYPTDGDRNFPVDSDSIVQLTCFDIDDNEVYDGDDFVDKEGVKRTAHLSCITIPKYVGNPSHVVFVTDLPDETDLHE